METWLDIDPPTWQWKHDPAYVSLRGLRIIHDYNKAVAAFVAASAYPDRPFGGGAVLFSGGD